MRSASTLTACIGVSIMLALGGAPTAAEADEDPCFSYNDTTPPSLRDVAFSPEPITTGLVRQVATATVSVADDCGVTDIYVTANPVGNISAGSMLFLRFELVSGSAQAGTWQATEEVSEYDAAGSWEATEVLVFDGNNVTTALYPGGGQLRVMRATETTLAAPSAGRVIAGAPSVLSGSVAPDCCGPTNGPAELQSLSASGQWITAAKIARDTYGNFKLAVKPPRTTTYRVAYMGDPVTAPSVSGATRVQVAAAVTSKMSAKSVRRGKSVTISGAVRPSLPGQPVVLQRLVGKRWVKAAVVKLTARSTYSFKVTNRKRGRVVYRVARPVDKDRLAGASPVMAISVS